MAEAQRLTSGPPTTTVASAQEELQVWYAPETYWPVTRRSVRVVKAVRKRPRRHVQVANQAAGKRVKSKPVIWEETTNFYATHLELGLIPPRFVADLGRSRWRIDTEVFVSHCRRNPPSFSETARLLAGLGCPPRLDSS